MADLMRVSGLSSGIDWEGMVEKLMELERRPVLMLQQQQSKLEIKRNAWMDVNSRLKNLSDKLASLRLASTFKAFSATSSDDAIATASPTASAQVGSYDITVTTLATATKWESAGAVAATDPSQALSKVSLRSTVTKGEFQVKVDGRANGASSFAGTISVDPSTDSLSDVMARIEALDPDYDPSTPSTKKFHAVYEMATDSIKITDDQGGMITIGSAADTTNFLSAAGFVTTSGTGTLQSELNISRVSLDTPLSDITWGDTSVALGNQGTFTINGVQILWDSSLDSLQSIIDKINGSDAGVTASYDALNDTFVLTAKQTGALNITASDGNGNLLNLLNVTDGSPVLGDVATGAINGTSFSSATNDVDLIPGMTIHLKDEGSATVTVATDTKPAKDAIQAFVDQYNSVMDFIATKLDYGEVEKTTDNGDLAGDPTLMRLQSTLRTLVSSTVPNLSGPYTKLADIGVGTTSQAAKLEIDTAKLEEALRTDPLAVQELFFGQVNVAAGDRGAVATASSEFSSNYAVASTNDGIRSSASWGSGQGWNDATGGDFTNDWVELSLGQTRTLEMVKLFTLDSSTYPASQYGIKDFDLEYWDGSTWQVAESVTGNTKGEITLYLNSVKTDRIRVNIKGSNDGQYSRLVEFEAYENNGLAARLGQEIDAWIRSGDGFIEGKSDSLQSSMDDLEDQIASMERRLELREESLYRQFIAMEQTLSSLQTQGNWLASQLAGLNANWLGNSD